MQCLSADGQDSSAGSWAGDHGQSCLGQDWRSVPGPWQLQQMSAPQGLTSSSIPSPACLSSLHPPASVPGGWARGGAKDSSGTCSVEQWEGDTSCDWGPGLLAPSQLDRAHTKEAILTPCQSSTHPAPSPSQAHPLTEEVCVGAWETYGARYTEPPWEVRGSHQETPISRKPPPYKGPYQGQYWALLLMMGAKEKILGNQRSQSWTCFPPLILSSSLLGFWNWNCFCAKSALALYTILLRAS